MKVDAHDQIYSRTCTVTKYCRGRLQPIVAVARLRGEVSSQGYLIYLHTQLRATMEKALRTCGCGNTTPIRSPLGYLRPPEPAASDNRLIFSRARVSTGSMSSWLAGSLTPVLTSRCACCLVAPIALLWRFREPPEDPLEARFLGS